MREQLISIIKILGVNYNEIIVDIDLDTYVINTIEIVNNIIVLHIFLDEMDIELNYDDINEADKYVIYQTLNSMLYN